MRGRILCIFLPHYTLICIRLNSDFRSGKGKYFSLVAFDIFYYDNDILGVKRKRQMEGATEDKMGELSMDVYK
jgi:hypothetical protein